MSWEPKLLTYDGKELANPSPETIAAELAKLTHAKYFLILETRDQWYIQTAKHGRYHFWLEYREGGPTHHHQTKATNLTDIAEAFVGFAALNATWKTKFFWTPITLPPATN